MNKLMLTRVCVCVKTTTIEQELQLAVRCDAVPERWQISFWALSRARVTELELQYHKADCTAASITAYF